MIGSGYMTRKAAASYLSGKGIGVSHHTLAKYASIGGGPKFFYFGKKPLYKAEDLDLWVLSRLSKPCHSTSSRTV